MILTSFRNVRIGQEKRKAIRVSFSYYLVMMVCFLWLRCLIVIRGCLSCLRKGNIKGSGSSLASGQLVNPMVINMAHK